jgi:hypothetical protein
LLPLLPLLPLRRKHQIVDVQRNYFRFADCSEVIL